MFVAVLRVNGLADSVVRAIGLSGLAIVGVLGMFRPQLLPQSRRQVPSWFTDVGSVGFFFFGVEMGSGMRTFAPTGLPHVAAAALLAMAANWWLCVATGIVFGIGRFVTIHADQRPSPGLDLGDRVVYLEALAASYVAIGLFVGSR